MKQKKKIVLFLLALIIFQFISPLIGGVTVYAATKTLTGPAANLHRQHAPSDFPASLSGDRWIHVQVNTPRATWHATKTANQQLIVDGGASYTPPSGYKIAEKLVYDVMGPRTYPLSIRDCTEETKGLPQGTAKPPYTPEGSGNCHPTEFEKSRPQNKWAVDINRSLWKYDRDEATWEGKTGPYYIYNVATKSGVAYDYLIEPTGGTNPPVDPCVTNPNGAGCTPGGTPPTDPGPPSVTPPPTLACPKDINVGTGVR